MTMSDRTSVGTRPSEPRRARLLGIAQGGDCLARVDGQVIFVPFGVPGEEVTLDIVEQKGDYARGRILEVISPSPWRTSPKCEYYGQCGGCQLQHVQYDHQLDLKREIVREQLQRIGRLAETNVLPTVPAEDPWGYRNHARFTVRRGELGFVQLRSRRFLRVDRCRIMHPAINSVVAQLQGKIQRRLHQVAIRHGINTGSLLIQPPLTQEEYPGVSGQAHYEEELLGHRFRVSSASFFQVNTRQAERLVSTVIEWLDPRGSELLLDVYCGVGSFGLILADRVGRVIGVEDLAAALRDAHYNAQGVDNITFIQGAAERVLPELKERVDAVILDPPRAGCRPEVISALARLGPERIVYVSCDPATLARDLRLLHEAGYRVDAVQPVDMFPQTQHVESVALLTLGS